MNVTNKRLMKVQVISKEWKGINHTDFYENVIAIHNTETYLVLTTRDGVEHSVSRRFYEDTFYVD